jgi:hypothetical protein
MNARGTLSLPLFGSPSFDIFGWKSKKVRCSGTQPCVRCDRASIVCVYHAAYKRGRMPWPIPASAASAMHDSNGSYLTRNQQSDSQPKTPSLPSASSLDLFPNVTSSIASSNDSTMILVSAPDDPERESNKSSSLDPNAHHPKPRQSMRNSPEPGENDLEGHYLGSTSSINFLVRACKRLRHLGASRAQSQDAASFRQSSIFTFGDTALSDYSGSTCDLPSQDYARELVERYFHFAMPTDRFLHQDTVERWLDRLYRLNLSSDRPNRGISDAEEAVLMMIFAIAMWYRSDSSGRIQDSPQVFESR